jgi:hypothetical protein
VGRLAVLAPAGLCVCRCTGNNAVFMDTIEARDMPEVTAISQTARIAAW